MGIVLRVARARSVVGAPRVPEIAASDEGPPVALHEAIAHSSPPAEATTSKTQRTVKSLAAAAVRQFATAHAGQGAERPCATATSWNNRDVFQARS